MLLVTLGLGRYKYRSVLGGSEATGSAAEGRGLYQTPQACKKLLGNAPGRVRRNAHELNNVRRGFFWSDHLLWRLRVGL